MHMKELDYFALGTLITRLIMRYTTNGLRAARYADDAIKKSDTN